MLKEKLTLRLWLLTENTERHRVIIKLNPTQCFSVFSARNL